MLVLSSWICTLSNLQFNAHCPLQETLSLSQFIHKSSDFECTQETTLVFIPLSSSFIV